MIRIPLKKGKQGIPSAELDRLLALQAFDGSYCIGVDEVGRGPLAGPVVVCACYIPKDILVEGIGDSKKVSPAKRQKIVRILSVLPQIRYVILSVGPAEIDRMNILEATKKGMSEAVTALKLGKALIDGNLALDEIGTSVIQGDQKSYVIAAASILAKEYRDQIMCLLDALYPHYGFAHHKGYPTREHIEALKKYGPCAEHRFSFSPVNTL